MSGSCPVSAHVCRETARERDELRDALGILVKRQTDDQLKIERLTRERDEARAENERLRAGIEEVLEDKSQHFHVTRKIPGATVTEYNDPLVRTSRLRALLNPTEGETDVRR